MTIRRTVAAVVAAFLAAAGLYAIWWHVTASRIPDAVAEWAAKQQDDGYDVSLGGVAVDGFPFSFAIAIDDISLGRSGGPVSWSWRSSRVVSRTSPFGFRRFEWRTTDGGRLSWRKAGDPTKFVVTAETSQGTLRVDGEGTPSAADIEASGLDIEMPAAGGAAHVESAHLVARYRPAGGAHDRDGAMDLLWSIQGLKLPPPAAKGPLGGRVESLSGEVRLSGLGPALADRASPRGVVTAWRKGGGRLVLQGFGLSWGPLDIEAKGTLALDSEMRPEGKIATAVRGYRETGMALVQAGVVPLKEATQALVLLDLMAKKEDGRKTLRIPFEARDGALYAGPLKLARLPPLQFPQ